MNQSSRTVTWVLPAYNESASIADLLDRIAEVSSAQDWRWSVVVVDDGSKDGTGDIVRAKAAEGLPVEVLRNEPNQGLGYTIRRGLRHAAERSGPDDAIITLDADLTQDPGYVPSMLAALDEGYDVAIASRYRPGSRVEGLATHRRLLSYGASGMVALVRPIRGVRDYSCGFRAYRASVLQWGFAEFGDDLIQERGFACMLEVAERLRENASFVEVPFVLGYDKKRKPSEIKIMPTIGAYARVIMRVAATQRKPVPVSTLAVAFGSVLLGAIAQVMIRLGVANLADLSVVDTLATAFSSPVVLGGLFFYGVSAALWLGVLSRMEVSVAYPLGASGYVLVVFMAWLAGEAVPLVRWGGVALILIGVMLVGWLGVAPTKGRAA